MVHTLSTMARPRREGPRRFVWEDHPAAAGMGDHMGLPALPVALTVLRLPDCEARRPVIPRVLSVCEGRGGEMRNALRAISDTLGLLA